VPLPITPMLDMAFQLLAFFIMTYSSTSLEGQLDLALPSGDGKDGIVAPGPAVAPPDFPSDLTIIVRALQEGEHAGNISAISVRSIAGAPVPIQPVRKAVRPRRVEQQEEADLLDGLAAYLQEARKTIEHKDAIKVQAAGRTRIKNVLRVMDICRANGFNRISFAPPEGAVR
jgi:biopolymer transport protein ExbD